MQSSSRRAFFTGRRTTKTPWEAFCRALRSTVTGNFFELESHDGSSSARLVPKHASDVHIARVLCAEHGVLLALDGVPHAARLNDHPVLWVDPGRDMAGCQRLAPDSTKWFVQPGCLLGELEAAGLTGFADLPCHITVAAWLADRTLCNWPSGQTSESGIEHASVLLADGTVAGLGSFGEHNHRPLDGLRLQQLVPALFELTTGPEAQACQQQAHWPGRYRLDALLPTTGKPVNLAHLLLGHGGDLGWVEWLVIDEQARPHLEPSHESRFSTYDHLDGQSDWQGAELDTRIKTLFDPDEVFPYPGQDV